MPALPSIVSSFVTQVQDSMTDVNPFVSAQDAASLLELLQEAVSASSEVTATGGSTTTIVVTSAEANSLAGAVVTFEDDTTTAALRGRSYTVLSNTGTTLTMSETMVAAAASGDTFTLRHGICDPYIASIRNTEPGRHWVAVRDLVAGLSALYEQIENAELPSRNIGRAGIATGAGCTASELTMNFTADRIDQFKGLFLTLGGETRKIRGNTESLITLDGALSSAPAASTSFTIAAASKPSEFTPEGSSFFGGYDKDFTAYLIALVSAAVAAYALPA